MCDPADTGPADPLVDVSSSYGHLRCFQSLLPLRVRTNPHTYISVRDPSDPLGATWLGLAIGAFERLHARSDRPEIHDVAIVGTGGGLDAIAISSIFSPERIVASDIHPRALDAARWNIAMYANPRTQSEVIESDLFRQYPVGSRFDLVYENLPNVPEGSDVFAGIRAASCYPPSAYRHEPVSDAHLLTLHYNCLVEAREHLRPEGWVVSMIGGRIAWPVIVEVFARAGFRAQVLEFGLKVQTEPDVVLDGYAEAEKNGSPRFNFYHPIAACRAILERHLVAMTDMSDMSDVTDMTDMTDMADVTDTVETRALVLSAALESCKVTASEAFDLHRRGESVCHSVYAVGGTLTPAGDSRGSMAWETSDG